MSAILISVSGVARGKWEHVHQSKMPWERGETRKEINIEKYFRRPFFGDRTERPEKEGAKMGVDLLQCQSH